MLNYEVKSFGVTIEFTQSVSQALQVFNSCSSKLKQMFMVHSDTGHKQEVAVNVSNQPETKLIS